MILHDTVVTGHVSLPPLCWWPALVNGSYPTTANLGKLIKLTARFPFLNHFIRPAAHCGTTGYNKTLISFPYDFSYIFPCTRSKLFYISITLLARLYPPLNQPNKPAVNWPSSPVDPRPRTRSSGFLNTLVTSVYADTKSGPFVRGFNVGYTASVGVATRNMWGGNSQDKWVRLSKMP